MGVGACTNVAIGTPEVGIQIGTAGDGCWLDSSHFGSSWMKRGATHQKLVPIQILPHNDDVPKLIRVIMVLCLGNEMLVVCSNN